MRIVQHRVPIPHNAVARIRSDSIDARRYTALSLFLSISCRHPRSSFVHDTLTVCFASRSANPSIMPKEDEEEGEGRGRGGNGDGENTIGAVRVGIYVL